MELQKMFIDGEWVEGSTGKSVPTLNPSNGEVLAMISFFRSQMPLMRKKRILRSWTAWIMENR